MSWRDWFSWEEQHNPKTDEPHTDPEEDTGEFDIQKPSWWDGFWGPGREFTDEDREKGK